MGVSILFSDLAFFSPWMWLIITAVLAFFLGILWFQRSSADMEHRGEHYRDQPVSVVIVCKNQAEYIEYGIRRLCSILASAGTALQVLLLVCPSSDDTREVAVRLGDYLPLIQVVLMDGEDGQRLESAVACGYELANHPLVLCFVPRRASDWNKLLALCSQMFRGKQTKRVQQVE